jgi:hypothetical protein
VRLAPSLLPTIRGAYAKASMALRLPMSGGFESFSNVRDIPFVARHASRTREEVCKASRFPSDKPVVLASFGGYGLTGPRHRRPREVQEVHGHHHRHRARCTARPA